MARTFINPVTGENMTISLKTGWNWLDGYKYNNMGRTSNASDVELAIEYIITNGINMGSISDARSKIQAYLKQNGRPAPNVEMPEILADAAKYITDSQIDMNTISAYVSAQNKKQQQNIDDYLNESTNTSSDNNTSSDSDTDYLKEALDKLQFTSKTENERAQQYNPYYRDIYSTHDQTLGGSIYDQLVDAEQNAAQSNIQLADAQMQQQAMAQAETVKAIADQVLAERIARLRAGMSESQIANQDMQTLMANMNTLNQQAQDLNYARLQANQQYNLAQDTAYQQWLSNANTMAQSGSAFAASDAGDLTQQALRYSKLTGTPLKSAYNKVSGNSTTS